MNPRKFLLPMIMLVVQASVLADGGAVQLRKEAGPLVISMFTSPSPLTAGPVDISLLVQDRNGLEAVLDADVTLVLRAEASGAQIRVRATREHGQNKLLYTAPVKLEAPGKWQVDASVVLGGMRAETAGVIEVAPNTVMLVSYWGYVAFPPVLIVAFVVNGWLIRRRE
jgi:hypothetical protein